MKTILKFLVTKVPHVIFFTLITYQYPFPTICFIRKCVLLNFSNFFSAHGFQQGPRECSIHIQYTST